MPRLWNQTIEEHRREVRGAIVSTTARLVAEKGLRSVTMSEIAGGAGIGRATLYKYFPDVESILRVWHEEQIAAHLAHLGEIRAGAADPSEGLEAVLEAYALLSHAARRHHDAELAASLHGGDQVARAEWKVHAMIRDLIELGVETGAVRDDVPPDELVTFSLHALSAAADLRSVTAVRRVVRLTLDGLRPPA